MFAKVHPAEDVKSGNTGSCHDLVRYLEKETGEGQRFFSHTEQDISPERVIMDIDGNKKALGANDAKFFMLSLNPSQSEQMHLIGRKVDDFKELTPQEKKEVFQKLEAFTRSAMDEYALNFGRDNIRGGQDLMYYARVETERSYHPEDEEVKQGIARIGEPKPGLNLHVHVIVSRKSLDGKVKLSPGAKSAGNTWELEGRGTVKRGFSHEGWKVRVQECFNRKFDYQAKEGETYVRPQVSAEIGKITNPELKRILQDEQFTAANQIVAAMREQGYTHQVRKGVHSFSREGEVFQVEHRLLKAFEQPLSDEQLKSITERFDLTKYEANPAGYRENGLQVKDISFSTYVKDEAQKGEKALKEVAYKVVYDEQNHTTVSFATVRQFAYEHQINLVKSEPTAEAVLKKIKNPELKNLLENYRFTSANQIVVAMKEQGYTHKVRKGVHSFSREGERVSIRPDTIYLNEVSQTHLIAPEKVIYIDYGDTCIQVSKAENTENIVRMIAATGKVEEFPRQTNVSLATEGGKFYTFNVDYRQQPEAFVYEIGEKRPEKKANVILTDNIIPAGERDQVMSRVYNAKRGIFNKGIVRNKIVFSVNNLHIYDNLLLFTFEIENKSKLPYDIDYIRYYIIDKKTAKLTASQEVDQQALFSENYSPRIEGNGRMKYVIAFDKFTIPDEKVFRIEINEKNGGRHVLFDLENSDIVNVEDI